MRALVLVFPPSGVVAQMIVVCSGDFSAKSSSELWWPSCLGLRIQLGIMRKKLLYCMLCVHWAFCVVVGQTLIVLEPISITFA